MCVLKASIRQGRYSSAYLYSGPYGDGKTTLARLFAKAVLCESHEDGEPCCKCESCLLFEEDRHFGYRELDAATYGGKDDMVNLRDDASSLSVSKKKIINIDESHDLSKQGQDALLKQTEECPEHLIYEFCTTDPDKMKTALRDRCMKFQISKVDSSLIAQRLAVICDKEGIGYQEDALQIIAERSEGHVRSAINILEEVSYLGEINSENLEKVSKDFVGAVFTILSCLGNDLPKMVDTYLFISSYISEFEFYSSLLSLVSDTAKFLYGYDKFTPKRLELVSQLKETHGYSIVEFLNYLITRDKFVEKVGIQSDLLVLHYKFSADNFVPRIQQQPQKNPTTNTQIKQLPESNDSSPNPYSYAELSKLSQSDRNKRLRQQRQESQNQKFGAKEKSETVPSEWPLPKLEEPGSITETEGLTPQEFSQRLVGGRVGEIRSVVDPRTE